MRHMVKRTGLIIASMVAILSLTVVPVGSAHGSDDHGDNAHATGATPGIVPEGTVGNSHVKMDSVQSAVQATDGSSSGENSGRLRDQAQQLLQDRRKGGKEHSQAERQKACTERRGLISGRSAHFGVAAQEHLDTFNKIFTRLQAYQTSKQLDVSGYDALVATATANQTAAQAAVDALKPLGAGIDCTQADPAGAVAAIKTAASDARTALQAYRASLKNLTAALKNATDAHKDSSTTGGAQ